MPIQIAADFEIKILDPVSVTLSRNAGGDLAVSIDDRTYEKAKAIRAFPLTAASACVAFTDSEGKELGIVEDSSLIEPGSRQVLQEALDEAYLATQVVTIFSVTANHSMTTWDMQTTRGRRIVHVRDRGEIRALSTSRVILTDINGIKYEVASIEALDEKSQTLLESEM
jgi:hypothetical protein